jgi:4-hydroxy-3-methylbut-2-enyl diphosphate reductase
VVGSPEEAERAGEGLYRKEPAAATVLIGQTTISPGEYRAIGDALKRFYPDIEILNTICGATADRRKALEELCAIVDAVVIAGGRESANTRRLLSLAHDLGKPAWLIEKPEDLPEFPEISAYETVGLSAGASTPDSLIDDIEKALKEKGNPTTAQSL